MCTGVTGPRQPRALLSDHGNQACTFERTQQTDTQLTARRCRCSDAAQHITERPTSRQLHKQAMRSRSFRPIDSTHHEHDRTRASRTPAGAS
eukprot:13077626-Alexandrium_andersonii.AAC.1